MTTGNAIPYGAAMYWMNSDPSDGVAWSGTVGTNVGVVTCGGVTHNDISVVVIDRDSSGVPTNDDKAVEATVSWSSDDANAVDPTGTGAPACAAGSISLEIRNWDSTVSDGTDTLDLAFKCMVCADNTACSDDTSAGLETFGDVADGSVYAAVNDDDATAAGTVNLAATGT